MSANLKLHIQPLKEEEHFNSFPGLLFSPGAVTPESCESLGEAAAESTISIISAHQACPHTGNPTKPARTQMTAPQRQHRWLAADHLEQKSWVTLRSQGDTTAPLPLYNYEEGEGLDRLKSRIVRKGNYQGTERGCRSSLRYEKL